MGSMRPGENAEGEDPRASADLLGVIARHPALAVERERSERSALARVRRWVSVWHRDIARGVDPQVEALLSLAGIDASALAAAERRLSGGLGHASELGVTIAHLGIVGQAYTRAVQRIARSEAEILAAIIGATPAEEREARLEDLIDDAFDLAGAMFELLHGAMFRDSMTEALTGLPASDADPPLVAISHVDIVGSTALLESAAREETERLVDSLFNAGQTAVRGRPVTAVKYVGDGVFLAGPSPVDVASAALGCVADLRDGHGLTARAGLAYGPVVLRAGDFFGLTVNVSYALTKAARPGTLLASAAAAVVLPAESHGDAHTVDVVGLREPLAAREISSVPTVRPASARYD